MGDVQVFEVANCITAMVAVALSLIIEPPAQEFVADRPFLVAIIAEDAPYFVATYRGP